MSRSPTVQTLALAAAALLPFLAACPGTLGERDMFPPGPRPGTPMGGTGGSGGTAACDAPTRIFKMPACATAGCHSGGAATSMGLDLTVPNPETKLIGVMAKTSTGCTDMPLIANTPGAPTGVFFTRLNSTDCNGSFGRMPALMQPLSDADLACITEWVASKLPQASPLEEEQAPIEPGAAE